jgi:hypothetical protein
VSSGRATALDAIRTAINTVARTARRPSKTESLAGDLSRCRRKWLSSVLDTLESASLRGEVAQSVEHTAENRGVAGSIPALATRDRRNSNQGWPTPARSASAADAAGGVGI